MCHKQLVIVLFLDESVFNICRKVFVEKILTEIVQTFLYFILNDDNDDYREEDK